MYPDLPRLVTQVNQIWFFLKPHTGKVFLGRDSFSVTQWVSPWAFWSVLLLVVVFFFAKAVGKQCQYRYSTQLHKAILNEYDKYTKLLWFCPTSRDWSKKLSLHLGDFCYSNSSPRYHFLKFSFILNGCLHMFSFSLTKLFRKLLY